MMHDLKKEIEIYKDFITEQWHGWDGWGGTARIYLKGGWMLTEDDDGTYNLCTYKINSKGHHEFGKCVYMSKEGFEYGVGPSDVHEVFRKYFELVNE